jgi:hypothetical protein
MSDCLTQKINHMLSPGLIDKVGSILPEIETTDLIDLAIRCDDEHTQRSRWRLTILIVCGLGA